MDRSNRLFEFGYCHNNDETVGLVPNIDLFNDGSELYIEGMQDLSGELEIQANPEGSVVFDFGDSVSQAADLLWSDQQYFFNSSSPLFSGLDCDNDATGPASQS